MVINGFQFFRSVIILMFSIESILSLSHSPFLLLDSPEAIYFKKWITRSNVKTNIKKNLRKEDILELSFALIIW
jgi:hypothetical protein